MRSKATDSATQITTLNNGLRTGMDLMIRDLMQAGQGLARGTRDRVAERQRRDDDHAPRPTRVQYSGPWAVVLSARPERSLAGHQCEQLTAIIPGPGMGPELTENGLRTDMMWILAG